MKPGNYDIRKTVNHVHLVHISSLCIFQICQWNLKEIILTFLMSVQTNLLSNSTPPYMQWATAMVWPTPWPAALVSPVPAQPLTIVTLCTDQGCLVIQPITMGGKSEECQVSLLLYYRPILPCFKKIIRNYQNICPLWHKVDSVSTLLVHCMLYKIFFAWVNEKFFPLCLQC